MTKLKKQDLKKGDIVFFPNHDEAYRYYVVNSGFGMSTKAIGSKIYGVAGNSKEEAIENYFKNKISNSIKWSRMTRRQPCKVIGNISEENTDEILNKLRQIKETTYKVLNLNVLAVATTLENLGWRTYIGMVLGFNHKEEWRAVLKCGSVLPYDYAKIMFPSFDNNYVWRNQ